MLAKIHWIDGLFFNLTIFFTATYSMSHVYAMKMEVKNSFVFAMTVFIPLLGTIALLAVICVLALTLRKKFNKFMKEMKVVPKELVS